jgi:hypothetical protein
MLLAPPLILQNRYAIQRGSYYAINQAAAKNAFMQFTIAYYHTGWEWPISGKSRHNIAGRTSRLMVSFPLAELYAMPLYA